MTIPLPNSASTGRQSQSRLSNILVQLQRLSERYDETYPDYIETLNEKQALEATIRRAIEDRYEFATERVRALAETAAEQKVEVLALQEVKQQFDVLRKNVEASRQTYDLVATRTLQESLQSRVDFVDVTLLARAVPATNSTTPPLFVLVLIGMIVGASVGGAVAVAIEVIQGRVRAKIALRESLRAPVLAEIEEPQYQTKKRSAKKRKKKTTENDRERDAA